MSNPKRYLKDIKEALRGVNSIMDDGDESTLDLAQIKAAAIQCQQATSTLYRLVGAMESELHAPTAIDGNAVIHGPLNVKTTMPKITKSQT